MACLYYTLGLWSTVLTAPTQRGARRALRLIFWPGSARRNPERVRELAVAVLQAQALSDNETIEPKGCLSVLLLPVMAAQLAFVFNQMIFSGLLVTPLLKHAWRARSQLADATAVELTRHPDGLAAGLVALTSGGGVIPGTETVAHLFVVGSEASSEADWTPPPGLKGSEARMHRRNAVLAAAAAKHSSPLTGFQPKMGRRVSALRAMGASVDFDEGGRRIGFVGKLAIILIGGPLIVVFYALMLGITVVLTGIAFAIYGMFLLTPVVVIDALLRGRS